jgi:hypothetical protein
VTAFNILFAIPFCSSFLLLSNLATMFNPSRDQARQFFVQAWHQHKIGAALTPLESLAVAAILEHPEYHADLESPAALTTDYSLDAGRTNPFLHLAMHLAIIEQLSIDHPPGICALYQQLVARNTAHAAVHTLMECLGQIVWEAQRLGTPFNNDRYIELIRQQIQR